MLDQFQLPLIEITDVPHHRSRFKSVFRKKYGSSKIPYQIWTKVTSEEMKGDCVQKVYTVDPLKSVVSNFCENHKGLASNMETVGTYSIFESSEANCGLRYVSYYGDRCSKVSNDVKHMYDIDSVTKYECIGHVQKRVGSCLRKQEIYKTFRWGRQI
ncbi:hypothetical protein TNCV_4727131 [Trichonephila clavipes]|nr:hypothetical protein TNCV_4727131 [Trichonephila clavipes]